MSIRKQIVAAFCLLAFLLAVPLILNLITRGNLCAISPLNAQESPCLVQEATISALVVENLQLQQTISALEHSLDRQENLPLDNNGRIETLLDTLCVTTLRVPRTLCTDLLEILNSLDSERLARCSETFQSDWRSFGQCIEPSWTIALTIMTHCYEADSTSPKSCGEEISRVIGSANPAIVDFCHGLSEETESSGTGNPDRAIQEFFDCLRDVGVLPTLTPSPTLIPFTPLPGAGTLQAQPSPSPTITPPIPTLLPGGTPPVIVTIPRPNDRMFIIPETIGYTLSSGDGVIGIGRFTLENFTTELLAQNPANPNQYIVVNDIGQMHFVSDYAHDMIVQMTIPIFTQFTYAVSRREDNSTAVSAVEWSQDGTLAFIVDGDRENFDGVWVWTPPQSYAQVIRDCPPEPGCQTVLDTSGLGQWESLALDWSPDSQKLLVTLNLPDEGRRGLIIVDRRASNPERIPGPVLRFDSGRWSADGSRVIVAGRAYDGTITLGSVLPDGSGPDLTDMSVYGYTWVQDPVEANGQVFALGSRNGRGSPQSIVTRGGEEVVGPIGDTSPERVTWSPDGRAVLVVTNDGQARRYYIASIDRRTVLEISEYVANGVALSWVSGEPTATPLTPEPPLVTQ